MDLQLTIPAAMPFREVATELVERFAAYAGAPADAAKSFAQAIEAAIAPVAEAQPDTPIDLKMSADDRELVVTTTSGSTTKRTTCPLPD